MATAFRALNEIMVMPLGVHGVPGQEGAGWELLRRCCSRDWLYISRDKTEKGARAQRAETLDLNAFLVACK